MKTQTVIRTVKNPVNGNKNGTQTERRLFLTSTVYVHIVTKLLTLLSHSLPQSGYSPSPELGELLEADSYGSLVLSRLCLFSGNITDPADARWH